MNISQLYQQLEDWLSPDLSCDWDNDGLMCCSDVSREVKKVLLTLDVTESAADKALSGGYDLIVSHHPLIFKPLSSITSPKLSRLIRGGVSVMSFHTRLDAAEGGVNDALADILGVKNTRRFTSDGIGVVGDIDCDITLESMIKLVKERLGSPYIEAIDGGLPCRKIALCGGDGKDLLMDAVASGADTYITGSMSYNSLVDAEALKINIITAGHFHTENPVLTVLSEKINNIIGHAVCDIHYCNPIIHK